MWRGGGVKGEQLFYAQSGRLYQGEGEEVVGCGGGGWGGAFPSVKTALISSLMSSDDIKPHIIIIFHFTAQELSEGRGCRPGLSL